MQRHSVVVTGIGFVTPLGNTQDELCRHVRSGTAAGRDHVDTGVTGRAPIAVCRVMKPFAYQDQADVDPHIQYGLAAARDALSDSGLDLSECDPETIGVVVSSSKGGVVTVAQLLRNRKKDFSLSEAESIYANLLPGTLSQSIAKEFKLSGPVKNIVSACATGTHSIIEGVKMVEDGEVAYCLAGASDASIEPFMLAGYQKMGVYASSEIRPFSKERDGFIIGEGAGVLLLEREESARARGARIYGKIDGYMIGQDVYNSLHFDTCDTTVADILKRLSACNNEKKIEYINMHGTGTRMGDVYETKQIKHAFGDDAYTLSLSSTKSLMGHLLGASGAVECIICLVSLRDALIPPTVNSLTPDPECDLDYTRNNAKERSVERVASLSMGFGGQVGALSICKV